MADFVLSIRFLQEMQWTWENLLLCAVVFLSFFLLQSVLVYRRPDRYIVHAPLAFLLALPLIDRLAGNPDILSTQGNWLQLTAGCWEVLLILGIPGILAGWFLGIFFRKKTNRK
ncbi:MAG: hypothetical protein IJ480_01990 [Clostridia bacterium]|nr:hypothetical protein [Clostridia bacterium]